MDYFKIHQNIIDRALVNPPVGYSENHHIIPRCLGGTNVKTNLVRLTAREHYVVHLLLVKMYPHEHKLVYAAHLMSTARNEQQKKERSNNRKYEWLRIKHAQVVSLNRKGKRGYKQTAEHKANAARGRTGLKRSEETKRRISEATKGLVKSDEHRAKISKTLSGNVRSQEVRDKISASNKGKPKSEQHRRNISDGRKRKFGNST